MKNYRERIYKGIFNVILAIVMISMFDDSCAFAQIQSKPAIDFKTYKEWPSLRGAQLSKNGRYVLFHVAHDESKRIEFVIKPVNKKWERIYSDLQSADFTSDSKYAMLIKPDGSTIYLDLEQNKEKKEIKQAKEMVSVKPDIDIQWNAAHTGIKITRSGEVNALENVNDYLTSADTLSLILNYKEPTKGIYTLYRYNLDNKTQNLLFESKPGEKIELEHINEGPDLFKVVLPFDNVNSELTSVDVWGYKDASAPMPFAGRKQELKSWQYAIHPSSGKIVELSGLNERLLSVKGDYALVEYRLGNIGMEFSWNEKTRGTYYLVSLIDGSRKLIHQQSSKGLMEATLSPDGNYVVFTDHGLLKYQAYDVRNCILVDLNPNVEISVTFVDLKIKFLSSEFYWVQGHALVVKDDYDLWKLDLSGEDPPLNLTEGMGKKNRITFWINKTLNISGEYLRESNINGYLLNAYDHKDKSWGFYKLICLSGNGLQKLSSGPYYYGGDNPVILKSDQGGVFLLTRGTAKEFPNLFVTKNFKTFAQLSDVEPEKTYNWMSSELLTWKTANGESRDGILYKPENFDPSKKYPTVVHIYNEYSSELNKFRVVQQDLNTLDIPWLVSNGYLVFVPDLIYREPGRRLKSTFDMLIPGMKYLASLAYVDPGKIGLQGASWGGEQVNYMVTHSNLFAAAFSGAGFSEHISASGFKNQYSSGEEKLMRNEVHFGGLLTEVPDIYIEESPLFAANKMETPLLIKTNINDSSVPFYQGLEFFILLRRLQKKAWMLQYDKGDHGVRPGKDCEDMNLRISQFFDHYLKGKPAPKWMTQGILPEYKQIDSGLELDAPEVVP